MSREQTDRIVERLRTRASSEPFTLGGVRDDLRQAADEIERLSAVSGGEGWEELERKIDSTIEAAYADGRNGDDSPLEKRKASLRALIAVARGGDLKAEYKQALTDCNQMRDDGSLPPASPPLVPTVQAETAVVGWRPMKDAPRDETDILLNHRVHGIIQGRFWPGSWTDDTPVSPREYEGDMWVLGDDLVREEVEFGPDGYENHGNVLGWLPLHQPPVSTGEQPGMSEGVLRDALKDLLWEWDCLGHGDEAGDPVPDQHPAAVKARAALAQAENCKRGGDEPQANAPSITLPDDLLSLSEAASWENECRVRRVVLNLRNKARDLDASDKPQMAEGLREEADAVERAFDVLAKAHRTLAARQNRAGETK